LFLFFFGGEREEKKKKKQKKNTSLFLVFLELFDMLGWTSSALYVLATTNPSNWEEKTDLVAPNPLRNQSKGHAGKRYGCLEGRPKPDF